MVTQRFTLRMADTDVPLDPQIRSWVVAGRAVVSLEKLRSAGPAHLAILGNVGRPEVLGARTGQRYAPESAGASYDLVRVVLTEGRALRLFYPQVDTVAYLATWPRDPLTSWWVAVPVGAGDLVLYGPQQAERNRLRDDLVRMRALASPADSAEAQSLLSGGE
jgi:hypothetical protein